MAKGLRFRNHYIVCGGGRIGEVTQVRCKVLAGMDKDKIIRRNVRGPVVIGDVLMLKGVRKGAGKARSLCF